MVRRLAIGSIVLLAALIVCASWWLTRRPLAYQARRAPLSTAGGEAPVTSDRGEHADAGPAPEDDAIELPEDAPPAVRTERVRSPSFERTENYLLAGVDHTRGGLWGRADTLLVAVFDDETGHVGVVSVPRDLYVEVPGHGPARVNATLRIATRIEQDPLELLRDVVADTLAMPIHHVVVADLASFERTVDRLGGVTVDVPCPIEDNFIDRREESGRRLLEVEAGSRHMDGVTAAMYVRSRHGRSDWDRARRQQAVLLALRDRVRDLGPTEWVPALADALDDGVTTTLSRLEMIALARRLARVEPERLHGLLLGSRQTTAYRTVEGRAVLLPDFDAIDASLAGLFEAPAPGTRPSRARCPPRDAALR